MGGRLDQVRTPDVVPIDPSQVAIVGPLAACLPHGRQWPRHDIPHQDSCLVDMAHLLKCGHIQTGTLLASATKTTMIESSAGSNEGLLLLTVQATAEEILLICLAT